MFNKVVTLAGKTFLIAVLFLLLNSTSISWAVKSTSKSVDNNNLNLVAQVSSNEYAQTADVTIRLEKNISEAKEEWPNSIETAQGAKRSPQKIEEYEDMEDPFAGNEKDIPILSDPFEGYNRWMFGVNESLYDSAVEPFVRGYRGMVDEDLRIGIRNMFNNALFPVKLLSSLIQLDFNKSGRVLARTLINTTWGFGGMADVAGEEFGIKDVNEDFDQALGSLGIPTGPYLVLPFFGPATTRNMVGRAADALMSPGALMSASFGQNVIINAEDNVNQISFIIDDKKQLDESAIDEYESIRDFYHQFRYGLLKK
ncbi:MAG: VacJ family lipoprotein [Nitrospinota bacterium]|nr:VacJ family lipoprotein [Nitrospinota bacterium]